MYNYSYTEMIDGHPITYHKERKNNEPIFIDKYLMSDIPLETQEKVFAWIKENFRPRKTPLDEHDSYTLKHVLERATDIYLGNNAFKDAMLQCGFEPVDYFEMNWRFRISKRSPAFIKDREFFR